MGCRQDERRPFAGAVGLDEQRRALRIDILELFFQFLLDCFCGPGTSLPDALDRRPLQPDLRTPHLAQQRCSDRPRRRDQDEHLRFLDRIVLTFDERLGVTAERIKFIFVGEPNSVPLPIKGRVRAKQRDE
jgi:hypothetical protein